MDVLVVVSGQRLRIPADSKRFVSGTKNSVRFVFNFDQLWDGMNLYAKFEQGENSVEKDLDAFNSVYLPDTLLPGDAQVSIYGTGTNKVAKSFKTTINLVDGTLVPDQPSGGDTDVDLDIATLNEVKMYLNIS